MIILEKMSVKFPELNMIADWRNDSMISLRSTDLTAKDSSQAAWVKSFGPSERYYFIYEAAVHRSAPEYKFAYLAGYCGLDKIHPVNRTAEIGLLISPAMQKRGYGTEAVRQLLKIGFETANLQCIFAEVIHSTNNWDFWLKQGFTYEGTVRARHFKIGRYCESRIGSVLKEDWLSWEAK